MRVFVFDLLPYAENLDYLKTGGELPWPLAKRYFKPDVAVKTYAEHLDAWVALERYGFDGIAFNEHHGTPYGMMNSPNLLAASIAQRTKTLKLLMYGNLLPLHNPLRLAEELAMIDCLSNGRLEAGVARGAPREYRIYDLPLSESRARFDECFEIMKKAWTEESFSYEGKFHSFKDVAIWPRPVQNPYPPIWVPVASKDSIEWAARNDAGITPGGLGQTPSMRDDVIRHYAKRRAEAGFRTTPDKLSIQINCYVADSKAKAIEEYGPYLLYLFNTLLPFDHDTPENVRKAGYYAANAEAHLRSRPAERVGGAAAPFGGKMTMEGFRKQAENMPIGTPGEVAERIVAEMEAVGASTVMLICNGGALPQELFLNQIKRLGEEVVPQLKKHRITRIPAIEDIPA